MFGLTISYANNTEFKEHEKSKLIEREFSVNKDATLYISNKYGNLYISSWDQNKIEIKVKIIVRGSNLSNVNTKLNSISVDFKADKNLVQAITNIKNIKSSLPWWKFGNSASFKINYHVKMPISNHADFNNKYGNIEIDVLKGKANIRCDYGKIYIDQLLNTQNYIDINYSNYSEINLIEAGKILTDYSSLDIEKSKNLTVNANYSNIKINIIKTLNYIGDYGDININSGVSITGNSDYSGIKIDTLHKNLTLNTDYGGISIKNLVRNFEKVSINSSYTDIKLETPSSNNFAFTTSLKYASFSYPKEKVEIFKSTAKSAKKYYEGIFGNTKNQSTLHIKLSYGRISLNLSD